VLGTGIYLITQPFQKGPFVERLTKPDIRSHSASDNKVRSAATRLSKMLQDA
jgi:hypothetical protein